MSDQFANLTSLPQEYAREGTQFLKRCQKPSRKEFLGIAKATAVGFLIMGFVGFFVKLIHIPINNVLGKTTTISCYGFVMFRLLTVYLVGSS